MAKNTLKNTVKEEKKPKSSKKTKKKKDKISLSERLAFISVYKAKFDSFWTNDKNRQAVGLVVLFSSASVLLSFISFYLNWVGGTKSWAMDQSEIFRSGSAFKYIFNKSFDGNNWLGKIGAYLSHYFLYARFGFASILIFICTGLFGARHAFNWYKVSLRKWFKVSFVFVLWGSPFFSFLSSGNDYQGDLGGAFGFYINQYLMTVVGKTGLIFLLLVGLLVILTVHFNLKIDRLMALMFSKDGEEDGEMELEPSNTVKEEVIKPVAFNIPEVDNSVEQFNSINSDADVSNNELVQEDPISLNVENNVVASEESIIETKSEIPDEKEQLETIDLSVSVSTSEKVDELEQAKDEGLSFTVEQAEEEVQVSNIQVDDKVAQFGEYDPHLDLSGFKYPPIDLLVERSTGRKQVDPSELEANKNRIVETLQNYKIEISEIKATIGPTITLYEIVPAPGVRISKIKNLEDDIALSLSALGIRIIAPMPGKGTVGIEVPNSNPDIVDMKSVIASEKFAKSDMDLPVALGKTIQNETFVVDLAKMPHLLMAGATGQGKSVGLNCILTSLLYKKHPSELKFVLVDPKKVELTLFNKIERHYLAKLPDSEEAIITDTSKVVQTVNSLCVEMDERYELLKKAMCRNLKEYNKKFKERKLNPENGHKYLPYIVLVIDEFADLIMTAGKDIETPIARLAQLARAIGIHLIVATQRPSVNIITGTIKANFPARVAFRVTAKIDSRTILDAGGADQLIGRGDMLYSSGSSLTRIQCAFVDTPEVEEICDFIGSQRAYPSAFMLPEVDDPDAESGVGDIDIDDRDEKFEEAARLVVMTQQGSTSMLQRKLKLGYNRAGRIVDQLEAAGVIGPFEGSKARKVLFPDEYSLEQFLNNEQQNGNL